MKFLERVCSEDKAREAAAFLKRFCEERLQADQCDCPFSYGEVQWGKSRQCRLTSELPPFAWKVGDRSGEQKEEVL